MRVWSGCYLWSGFDEAVIRLRSGCDHAVIRYHCQRLWSAIVIRKLAQTVIRLWPPFACCDHIVNRLWSCFWSGWDWAVIMFWSVCDQMVIRVWSGCDQILWWETVIRDCDQAMIWLWSDIVSEAVIWLLFGAFIWLWSDCDQAMIRGCYQAMIRGFDLSMVRLWSECDVTLIGLWSVWGRVPMACLLVKNCIVFVCLQPIKQMIHSGYTALTDG